MFHRPASSGAPILGLCAAVALAGALWLVRERAPSAESEQRAVAASSSSSDSAVVALQAAGGDVAVAESSRLPLSDAAPTDSPPPHGFGVVQVRAVDDGDQQPLPGFVWALTGDLAGVPGAGKVNGYSSAIRVPIGRPVALRVAANGYVQTMPIDVSLAPGVALRALDVRLVRVQPDACVTLRVCESDGAPVAHVRVTCWRQPAPHERDADLGRNAWQPMWTRASAAADGVHRFADLGAGRFRFKVQALEPAGRPRLLQPETCTVVFDAVVPSTTRIELRQPAGTLILSVRDSASGKPLGPGLSVTVTGPSGASDTQHWIALDGVPADPAAGTLPAAATCELWEALPPGRYLVRVVGAGLDLRRELDVGAGMRATLTLP